MLLVNVREFESAPLQRRESDELRYVGMEGQGGLSQRRLAASVSQCEIDVFHSRLRVIASRLLYFNFKPLCASGGNCRIRGIGSWHCCPAAPLDDQSSVPRRGLIELRQFRRRIGLLPEPLDADRCKRVNYRSYRSLFRHLLRSPAERPSENRETEQ